MAEENADEEEDLRPRKQRRASSPDSAEEEEEVVIIPFDGRPKWPESAAALTAAQRQVQDLGFVWSRVDQYKVAGLKKEPTCVSTSFDHNIPLFVAEKPNTFHFEKLGFGDRHLIPKLLLTNDAAQVAAQGIVPQPGYKVLQIPGPSRHADILSPEY